MSWLDRFKKGTEVTPSVPLTPTGPVPVLPEVRSYHEMPQRTEEAYVPPPPPPPTPPKRRYVPPKFEGMGSSGFEHWVVEFLRSAGYQNVVSVGGRGDGGIDGIAFNNGIRYIIQCKCYAPTRKVGIARVREFAMAVVEQSEPSRGLLFTSGGMIMSTRQYALEHGIDVFERDEIIRWHQRLWTEGKV
jgi:hypothetical protein